MKKLFFQQADKIINQTILDHFAIEVNSKCDIAHPDKMMTYAIKQALIHAVGMRYPEASPETVRQCVSVILCHVFHVDPQITGELGLNTPSINLWGDIVDSVRHKLTWRYAGSCMNNEELYKIIVEAMLKDLEGRFFN